jgi:hypothetical protein
MSSQDKTLVRHALQGANQSLIANNHTEKAGDGTWLGEMHDFRQAGIDSMTVAGAGFLYGSMAVLAEFWRPYPKYADVGTDFFFQIDMEMLSLVARALTLYPPWDVNQDGTVDIYDVVIVAVAYDATPADARWNPMADMNADGIVDIRDLRMVAIHFGEQYA